MLVAEGGSSSWPEPATAFSSDTDDALSSDQTEAHILEAGDALSSERSLARGMTRPESQVVLVMHDSIGSDTYVMRAGSEIPPCWERLPEAMAGDNGVEGGARRRNWVVARSTMWE